MLLPWGSYCHQPPKRPGSKLRNLKRYACVSVCIIISLSLSPHFMCNYILWWINNDKSSCISTHHPNVYKLHWTLQCYQYDITWHSGIMLPIMWHHSLWAGQAARLFRLAIAPVPMRRCTSASGLHLNYMGPKEHDAPLIDISWTWWKWKKLIISVSTISKMGWFWDTL